MVVGLYHLQHLHNNMSSNVKIGKKKDAVKLNAIMTNNLVFMVKSKVQGSQRGITLTSVRN